jgi:hypothetical protein
MLKSNSAAAIKVSSRCNVCGAHCRRFAGSLARESAGCSGCGSTARMRTVVLRLSEALFGEPLALPDFPVCKHLRGVGLSDWDGYARRLVERLDYMNTWYHQAPQLNVTTEVERSCDFSISSDVFEHGRYRAPSWARAACGSRVACSC